MADVITTLIFDDSKALPGIKRVTDAFEDAANAADDLNKTVTDTQQGLGKKVVDTNKQIQDSTQKTAEVEKKALKEKIAAQEVYGVSLNKISETLRGYRNNLMNTLKVMGSYVALSKTQEEGVGRLVGVFGGGGKAIRAFAVGFNILKVAIASTGIGALVLALGGLISFFTRTQKGADFLSAKFAGLKTAVAVLGDVFSAIGEKIFDAFDNPKKAVVDLYETVKTNIINRFKSIPLLFGAIANGISAALDLDKNGVNKALEDTGRAFVQFTTGLDTEQQKAFGDAIAETANNMSKAAAEAEKLERRKQALADEQIRLTKAEAEARKFIEENKLIAEDTTKSYFERIGAAEKAIGKEKSLLDQKLVLSKKNVEIMKAEQNLTNNMRSDYEALAQAEAEVANLSAESATKQIELQNKINGLVKEYRDALTASSDKLFEIAAAYGVITEKDQLKFVADKQVEELEKLRTIFLQTVTAIDNATSKEDKEILEKLLGTKDLPAQREKIQGQIDILNKSIEAVGSKFNADVLIAENEKVITARLLAAEKDIKDTQLKENRKREIQLEGEAERLKILVEYGDKSSKAYQENILRLEEIANELKPLNVNELLLAAEKVTTVRLQNADKEIKDSVLKENEKKKLLLEGEAARLRILVEFGDKTSAEYEKNVLRLQEIGSELKPLSTNELIDAADKITNARLINAEKEIQDVKEKERQKKIITLEGEAERLRILIESGDKTSVVYQQQLLRLQEIGNELKPLNKKKFLDDVEDFDDLLTKSISKIFNLNREDVGLVIGGLQTFVSQFGSLLAESQQIALDNVDKQIERLSERRGKLEDELTKEQELYDKGLANNLDAKKAEVDGLIAEEDRLLKEREKLEKEAQKRQLIADTISQAQALITASIQIAKGFSPLGPFAIPLSIAAIGSLFALFAKVKVDAFKATKLYTGADRIDDYFGVPDQYGKTDKGTGKGYRLWDEQLQQPTNVIISAREMLIPEDVASRQKAFFDNLKAGMYEGMDLARFIHESKYKGGSTSIVNNNNVTNVAVKKKVRQFVPFTGKDGKQRAILKTITEDMADGTVIEFDY